MKLPKKILVGAHEYSVELRSLTPKDARDDSLGFVNKLTKEIVINKDKNVVQSEETNTLLHEVLHIIWQEYYIPAKDEEEIIIKATNGLCAVLNSNPKLRKYLLESF